MTTVVDVVNFNADASCLPVADWLRALAGGTDSALCRWLRGYVEHGRKVALGLVGATVAEIATQNPEAIALINAHPETFEVLLRPFAHDVALLRDARSFRLNVELGRAVIEHELRHVTPYFLPPEFMLTNEQVALLGELGVAGVFINSGRFRPHVAARIPTDPYVLHGLLGSRIQCLPFFPALTAGYLESLHAWSPAPWHAALARAPHDLRLSWRDGESWLFVPEGLDRELAWLAAEGNGVTRAHVRDVVGTTPFRDRAGDADAGTWWSYPVHSFFEWVKEFRMFGYLRALRDAEARLAELSADEKVVWLSAAGSDVLSAVEKDDPQVQLVSRPPGGQPVAWSILRSPRGFEGEEYLAILQRWGDPRVRAYVETSTEPHLVRLRLRLAYVRDRRLLG